MMNEVVSPLPSSPTLTQDECLVLIKDVLSPDTDHRKLHLVCQLDSIVTVLKFLHVPPHGFEWRLVDLPPVHDPWVHLVK